MILAGSYGQKRWTLRLKEEYGVRMFESRMPKRILGSKRKEIIGNRRNLRIFTEI
jgi:hypothetical protein